MSVKPARPMDRVDGRLKVTGQLGDVMQESAQAAHSWAWSSAEELGLDPEWFAKNDVHVHVPAGAQPKDGPSAGVAIATAIVSVASNRPVSSEVAMTGEITLTGQVLQIGGVREKTLAAQRAGVKKVVLPRENSADLADVPDEVKAELEFVLADEAEQVLEVAFDGAAPGRRRRAAALPGRKAASAA